MISIVTSWSRSKIPCLDSGYRPRASLYPWSMQMLLGGTHMSNRVRLVNRAKYLDRSLSFSSQTGNRVCISIGDWLDGVPLPSLYEHFSPHWNYWLTVTFRHGELSLPAVRRQVVRLNRKIRPDLFFWGTELGHTGGRSHIHGLMYFEGVQTDAFMEDWQNYNVWKTCFDQCGRSKVEKFEPSKGAAHYISKYVAKGLNDFDLFVRPEWKRKQSLHGSCSEPRKFGPDGAFTPKSPRATP